MKKRLFLALTAFSLSLAGCGNDPKDTKPEEQEEKEKDPTPKDPLTPEQRQNATEFNTLLTTVLNIAKADSTGSEEYVLKYAEELAAADYKSADLQSLIIVAMQTLNISDPSKITADDVFGLLETCESMSLLDDAIYFAVAFAKSYGRAYANSNEEAGEFVSYVLDAVDEEGYDIPRNLYEVAQVIVPTYADFHSVEFTNAVEGAFNEEDNTVDLHCVKEIFKLSAESLEKTLVLKQNVKYFADFLGRVISPLLDTEDEEPELRSPVSGDDDAYEFNDVIDKVFGVYELLIDFARELGDIDDEKLAPLSEIATLLVNEKYIDALKASLSLLIDRFLDFITLSDEADGAKSHTEGIINVLFGDFGTLSFEELYDKVKELYDLASKTFSIEALREIVPATFQKLADLSSLSDSVVALNETLIKVIKNTLVNYFHWEENEAEEYASQFDYQMEIVRFFDKIAKIHDYVQHLDSEDFYAFVNYFNTDEYVKIFDYLLGEAYYLLLQDGYYESVYDDITAIYGVINNVYDTFTSDEFKAEANGVVNEDKQIDRDKLIELLGHISQILEPVVYIKDNVSAVAQRALSDLEDLMFSLGYTEEEIDDVFEKLDINGTIDTFFDAISAAVDYMNRNALLENEDVDKILEMGNLIVQIKDAIKDPESSYLMIITPLTDFVKKFFEFTYAKLGIERDPQEAGSNVIMLGFAGYLLYAYFTNEDFKASVKATFNKDTYEIDFEALKEVVAGVGSVLTSLFAVRDDASDALDSALALADIFAEIVSKAAEKEVDAETLASVKEGITALFVAINELGTFLANGEGQTDRIFEFADLVYSSALELKNEIDLIADNPDKSKLEKAEEIYDLVIAKSKEIIGKIYTFLTSTETAEIEA